MRCAGMGKHMQQQRRKVPPRKVPRPQRELIQDLRIGQAALARDNPDAALSLPLDPGP